MCERKEERRRKRKREKEVRKAFFKGGVVIR